MRFHVCHFAQASHVQKSHKLHAPANLVLCLTFSYIDAPPKGKIPGIKYNATLRAQKTFDFLGSTASIEDENINKSISIAESLHACVCENAVESSAPGCQVVENQPAVDYS
jgi:hypothetical protein